jgi:RNA polymerase sigma-70 factor (sigma-E family)
MREITLATDGIADDPIGSLAVAARPSFDDLYRSRFDALVRVAFVFVDTQHEAEEVVQDAFAALYTRYRRVENPDAYVRRAVLNGARQVLRRRRVARSRPAPVPVDAQLEYNHVIDAVRRLPHRQRAVVVLRYELQLSDSEIAAALRIPVGTAKSTIHRAIARLRQEVQP